LKTISLTHHRARQLRHNLTHTEKKLRACLRSGRFSDHRFRRQFPIGNFIADFACTKTRLVVELDGARHLDRTSQDAWRTKLLEQRGYKVIRFWDNEVLADITGVLERIEQALSKAPAANS
jgi:very-short-patch-repair endonuclease